MAQESNQGISMSKGDGDQHQCFVRACAGKQRIGKSVGKPHVSSRFQPYGDSMSHGNSGLASPAPIYNADMCPVFYLANILY